MIYSVRSFLLLSLFFFNDTATTEIYTLSLHDALPILDLAGGDRRGRHVQIERRLEIGRHRDRERVGARSEEHTSELQSHSDLVCRLLLEKKKKSSHENVIESIQQQLNDVSTC